MRLRPRTWLLIGSASTAMVLALVLMLPQMLLRSFEDLERDEMRRNADRAARALAETMTEDLGKITDWSNWDDCYRFVRDGNPGFVSTNLTDATFRDLGFDVFLFVDLKGRIVYGRFYSLDDGRDRPIPAGLLARVRPGGSLLMGADDRAPRSGVLMIPEGALLVVARPILTSNGTGPARGTMVCASVLGADDVRRLAERTLLDLDIARIDLARATGRVVPPPSGRAGADSIRVRVSATDQVVSDLTLRDMDGRPALLIEVHSRRSIYRQGVRSAGMLALCVMLAAGLMGGLTVLLIERQVLRRVTRMNGEIAAIATRGDPDGRLTVEGHDELGEFASHINAMLDSLQASQRALRENESILRTFYDHGAIQRGLVELVGDDVRFIHLNEAAALTFGATPEQVIGRCGHELGMGGPGREIWTSAYREAARRGGPHEFEYVMERDGDKRVLWAVLCPLETPASTRFAFAVEDVTERRRTEVALREARDAADAANRAKSQFLATMSHEIRTPMNGVMGMTSLLLETPLDVVQQDYARLIQTSAEALLALLNDILDLSKIEADRMTLEPQRFDLLGLLEDIAELQQGRTREKGIELVVQYAADAPRMVVGDSLRLRQVVLNLLGNAVKFTSQGSIVVAVTSTRVADDRARLRVSVTDTGLGIPADRQAALFQPFTQADASTTRRFGGSGLGLAISKRLIELMGGTMGLVSTEGAGSTFWFEVELPTAADEAPAGARPPQGTRVLVMDDLGASRASLTETLKAAGLHVHAVASPSEMLALLRETTRTRFDALIADAPADEALALAMGRAIESSPATRTIPRVLLTSRPQRGDGPTAEAAGWGAYLAKPVRASLLLAALEAVLRPPEQRLRGVVTRHSLAEEGRQANVRAAGDADLADLRVLVAEDNPTNQKVALRMLETLGFDVSMVADGSAAVQAVASAPFDLVLMDVQMPVMDGLDATRAIRALPTPACDVPIIALTASAIAAERQACIDIGMDDFVSKPVKREQLAKTIRSVLDRRPRGSSRRAA